jgi:hypothetical protein
MTTLTTEPTEIPHGFVHDLDEQEYHAHQGSLSVSGAKVLLKAPALYKWQQDHPVHKDVFDVGSAAHKVILGVGDPIDVIDADNWRRADAQTAQKASREAGHIPLLRKDYNQVCDMADVLASHKLAMQLLTGGQPEVSAFAADEPTGVLRRGRFDYLGPNVIVDYKSAISADPRDIAGRYGAMKKFGYDLQADWYLRLARDLGHPAQAFALIFQMKEPPYLVTVATIREDDLWEASDRNRRALEIFRDCTESGVWPGFLPDDTAAVVSLDQQTYEEELIG